MTNVQINEKALEAEALVLFNAVRKVQGMTYNVKWDELGKDSQRHWLAVAKAAHELRETTNE